MPKPKKPPFDKPLNIRTGDKVMVLSGTGRGPEPRLVLSVLPKENKVLVEGVNVQKDRQKPQGGGSARPSGINSEGGIVDKPTPIHRSNVALIDPKTGKATRVKVRKDGDKRVRIAKSGETI